jgi:DNA mismatch endonuclease (patch repair protein)
MTQISRSENMRRIRSKDTRPEMVVRRLLFRMGYRYRVHLARLPGRPDIGFVGRRKLIFVHGCFWHQHPGANCSDARLPKSRLQYWLPKLQRTCQRDAEHLRDLRAGGWNTLVIWECETRDQPQLARKLSLFLDKRWDH